MLGGPSSGSFGCRRASGGGGSVTSRKTARQRRRTAGGGTQGEPGDGADGRGVAASAHGEAEGPNARLSPATAPAQRRQPTTTGRVGTWTPSAWLQTCRTLVSEVGLCHLQVCKLLISEDRLLKVVDFSLPGLVMDNRGKNEHEEELDFHLGTANDSSLDDENIGFKFIIKGKAYWW